MSIHAGKKIEPGGRYDRLLTFLRNRGYVGATTRELVVCAEVCAVNSTVSELRAMGYDIECEIEPHREGRSSKVYRYRLVTRPKAEARPGELFA
jgi:hypothetical protein